jgi:hypothetical protein
MNTSSADGMTKRCPQCRRNTLVFKAHDPVLTTATALARTGTDPLDGRDRLHYESAWVCENPRCDYREVNGEQ